MPEESKDQKTTRPSITTLKEEYRPIRERVMAKLGNKPWIDVRKPATELLIEEARKGRTDLITGFLNLKGLLERLNGEIESSKRSNHFNSIGLIAMDLDHFKALNDTFGHPHGNVYLKHLADLLNKHLEGERAEDKAKQNIVRSMDTISRPGGDEFAIVLPNINEEGIQVVAERLRKIIADDPEGPKYWKEKITASIGATVVIPERKDTTEQIRDRVLDEADIALYNAKHAGRNTFVVFQKGMQMPNNEHGIFRTSPQS